MKTAVVFIHGFTGSGSTWVNATGNSFLDLLQTDPTVNGFDFFEFSYFTKLTDFFNSAPFQKIMSAIPFINRLPGVTGKVRMNRPIAQLSEELATYLNLTLEGYDEVILIAHSMGGLIAKDHILNSQPGHGPKPVGYISIAVPHKGSLGAQLLGPLNNINAKELVPLSEQCDKLNNEWIEQRNNLPPAIYMLAQHDEVVVKESALPYSVKKEQKIVVSHDHTSICKPVDRTDLSYLAVRKFLDTFTYEKTMGILSNESSLLPTPEYDKEIFVLKMIVCDIGRKGIADAKDCFFSAEIISKAANKKDAAELRALQRKVLSLYQQKFNACNGKKMSSNDIFAEVHSEITTQDSGVLKSTVKYLNFLHKKGLLHQLANNLTDDVVWADDTDFEKIRSTIK
ncbi:ABC-three component system protein [Undibacterium fentianense]|uniref:ABC-three component systems C-terminal domain-containing protein n=1 Tax=Undibacterium fentianense TaxID=2828728 RepID=A0A941IFL5_9BURK|nr:ABC-three component system protein [Undibacterium fentianense]MBR7799155.1 hypothetical protein [Undibacterium fentianense]